MCRHIQEIATGSESQQCTRYKLSSINCMNELEKRLKEYKSAAMEFKRVLERREESITECKQEIQLFLESFPAVIEEMQQRFAKEGKYDPAMPLRILKAHLIKAGTAVFVGTVAGTTVGSVIGTTVFPVVGTVVGAGVGAAYAIWKSWFSEAPPVQLDERTSRILQNLKLNAVNAQDELDKGFKEIVRFLLSLAFV